MNENFSEKDLDNRLAKADPTKRGIAPTLDESLLAKAASADTKLTLRARFQSMTKAAKTLISSTAAIASAAAVTAVALVVSTPSAPLIELAAQQGRSANEASGMVMNSPVADKMMMPYQIFEYSPSDDLSKQGGNGTVYKLVRTGDPEQILQDIARIFEVKGSVKKFPDFSKDSPGYFFGESDDPWDYQNMSPSISLWWNGTGSWYYSNPIAYPEPKCLENDESGFCISWEEQKPTPELLPSREEAVSKALEIFNGTGLEVTESDLRVYMDDWGVNIMASLEVAGTQTSIEWYVGWASNGQLSYAGGNSVTVEEVGNYNTISAFDAVQRLSDWRWSGSPSPTFYEKYQGGMLYSAQPTLRGGDAVSSSDGSESSDATGDDTTVVEPTDEPTMEPMEPETVQLKVVESVETLLTIWDAKGDVWLVPGYLLVNDQGWFGAVIALIQGVIALPEATEFDIMPLPADDTKVGDK